MEAVSRKSRQFKLKLLKRFDLGKFLKWQFAVFSNFSRAQARFYKRAGLLYDVAKQIKPADFIGHKVFYRRGDKKVVVGMVKDYNPKTIGYIITPIAKNHDQLVKRRGLVKNRKLYVEHYIDGEIKEFYVGTG